MSINWIVHEINTTIEKFQTSVLNLIARTEAAFKEHRRRLRDHEQRLYNLEQRPYHDEVSVQGLVQNALAEQHLLTQRGDPASPQIEAMVERLLRKIIVERQLEEQRKDSAEPNLSTSAHSSSGTGLLCARCHGLVDADSMEAVILPSFDEFSRGINPLDMTYDRLNENDVPSEAYSRDWQKLSGEQGEDSDEEGNPALTGRRRTDGRIARQVQPVHTYSVNTWS